MNIKDRIAFNAINTYYTEHDKYPPFIEASADYFSEMSCTHFDFAMLNGPIVRVPVVQLGDMAHEHVSVRHSGTMSLSQARVACYTRWNNEYERITESGCIVEDLKTRFGENLEEGYAYYQLSAVVYGHELILEKLASKQEEKADY